MSEKNSKPQNPTQNQISWISRPFSAQNEQNEQLFLGQNWPIWPIFGQKGQKAGHGISKLCFLAKVMSEFTKFHKFNARTFFFMKWTFSGYVVCKILDVWEQSVKWYGPSYSFAQILLSKVNKLLSDTIIGSFHL